MDSKRDRISVYVNREMRKRVEEKANELGISISALIIIALDEYLKQSSVVDMAEMFKQFQKQMEIVGDD